jgi:hypothetical protein
MKPKPEKTRISRVREFLAEHSDAKTVDVRRALSMADLSPSVVSIARKQVHGSPPESKEPEGSGEVALLRRRIKMLVAVNRLYLEELANVKAQ